MGWKRSGFKGGFVGDARWGNGISDCLSSRLLARRHGRGAKWRVNPAAGRDRASLRGTARSIYRTILRPFPRDGQSVNPSEISMSRSATQRATSRLHGMNVSRALPRVSHRLVRPITHAAAVANARGHVARS